MKTILLESCESLNRYISQVEFKGYDPYDILNSPIRFDAFGKWGPVIAIQIHKRNPINLREVLGIQKEHNPKAMGLLLKAYCLLYNSTKNNDYLENANYLFQWINQNFSNGYSGKCWGYNFPWASSDGFLPAYTPSVVVTSFVVDGVYEYYRLTGNNDAKELVLSASVYITKDIPIVSLPEGISYSYTHLSKGCCYNASLLAAEILAKADHLVKTNIHQESIERAVDFVLSKQQTTGEWWYSFNPEKNTERYQIDFHQGFVLNSLHTINNLLENPKRNIDDAIMKGADYYKEKQFHKNGRSMWRLPKEWPVDIHNQSQGIITFSKLETYDPDYLSFALRIADWTINNMLSKKGFFYYRKTPLFMNKIPYIRWSQAWMLLALSELVNHEQA